MEYKFPTVTDKEWKQKLQFLLKGEEYNKTLQWKSNEGIIINPFYSGESIQKKAVFKKAETQLTALIYVNNVQKCIEELDNYKQKSVQFFILKVPNKEICTSLLSELPNDYQYIIKLSNYSLFDEKKYTNILKNRNLKITFDCDIIGNFTRFGNWFYDKTQDLRDISDFLNQETSCLTIDSTIFKESGATIIQQLAYSILLFVEYSNYLKQSDIPRKLILYVGIGSNYFFEIAKLKAFRWIFENLVKTSNNSFEIELIAQPSRRELTLYNVQRNYCKIDLAMEVGIFGNANYVVPIQAEFYKKEKFTRIEPQLNQTLCKLKVYDANTIEDNFYVEALVHEIADKSLKLSKELERLGGYLSLLKSNVLQKRIRQKVNNVPDTLKSSKLYVQEEEWEIFPFLKKKIRKTQITPLYPVRNSEKEEKEYYKK